MSGPLFAAGGKSRSTQGKGVQNYLQNQVEPNFQPLQSTLMQQITEALRTGGIGAQLPIVQQAVSGANQATSTALRGTEDSLARAGLSRTPYGQSILAGQRQTGAQQAAAIPTNYAQQFISAAPQYSQGILGTILGALSSRSSQRSGPYAT